MYKQYLTAWYKHELKYKFIKLYIIKLNHIKLF